MKSEPHTPCCDACVFSTLRDDALWCRYSLYLPTLSVTLNPEDSCDKHQVERSAQKPVQE